MDQKDHRIANSVTSEKELWMMNQESKPKNLSKGHNVHQWTIENSIIVMGWQILNRGQNDRMQQKPQLE